MRLAGLGAAVVLLLLTPMAYVGAEVDARSAAGATMPTGRRAGALATALVPTVAGAVLLAVCW